MRKDKPFTMPSDEELRAGDEADLRDALALAWHDWRYQTGEDSHESDPPDCIRWANAVPLALASETTDAELRAAAEALLNRIESWDPEYIPAEEVAALRAALSSSGSIDAERLARAIANGMPLDEKDEWYTSPRAFAADIAERYARLSESVE